MSDPQKKQNFLQGTAMLAMATAIVKVIGALYKIPLNAIIGEQGFGYFNTAYDIYNVLLQVMDYATLTDNTGRKADFRNVVIIMTTNAGAREMQQAPVGFCSTSSASDRSAGAVEQTFSPEFRNRLDAMIPFRSLSRDLMGRIVDKTMAALEPGLAARRVSLTLTDAARNWLSMHGFDPRMGARPLQRVVRSEVEDQLAGLLLFGSLEKGGRVVVDAASPDAPHLTLSVSGQRA